MTTDNLDKLNHTFRLKTMRREGVGILRDHEQKDFGKIAEKFNKYRVDTERLYRAEYKTRVEVVRRELMNKAGSKTKELKPAFGMIDRFNARDLTRQSQINVRLDHQQSMDRLDRQELKTSESFLETSSQRKKYQTHFKQSAEHRRTQSRRESPDRRRSPSPKMSD